MMSYIYFFRTNNLTADHLLIFFLKKFKKIIFQKIFDFFTISFEVCRHHTIKPQIKDVKELQILSLWLANVFSCMACVYEIKFNNWNINLLIFLILSLQLNNIY